jgi:hypothetical protein
MYPVPQFFSRQAIRNGAYLALFTTWADPCSSLSPSENMNVLFPQAAHDTDRTHQDPAAKAVTTGLHHRNETCIPHDRARRRAAHLLRTLLRALSDHLARCRQIRAVLLRGVCVCARGCAPLRLTYVISQYESTLHLFAHAHRAHHSDSDPVSDEGVGHLLRSVWDSGISFQKLTGCGALF